MSDGFHAEKAFKLDEDLRVLLVQATRRRRFLRDARGNTPRLIAQPKAPLPPLPPYPSPLNDAVRASNGLSALNWELVPRVIAFRAACR